MPTLLPAARDVLKLFLYLLEVCYQGCNMGVRGSLPCWAIHAPMSCVQKEEPGCSEGERVALAASVSSCSPKTFGQA